MQSMQWYLNRVSRMSVGELAYRGRKVALTQLQRRGWLRARRTAVPARLPLTAPPPLLQVPVVDPQPYVAAAERLLAGRWDLFALRDAPLGLPPPWNRDPRRGDDAPPVYGPALDYRDERLVGDIKYLWELNRHLELVTLAQAWRLTGDGRYLDGLHTLLDDWLVRCPYPHGANWSSSLELGIRLINWSLVWELTGGAAGPLFARDLRQPFLAAVHHQQEFIAGHLSRFSSANNHLIGEAAGLFVAACTFPFWEASAGWRQTAQATLMREALAQNAPDGVNREQAIAYQSFVFDFLLIAGLRGARSGMPFPATYWQRMEAMAEFVAAVMDAGGHVPQIGDADDGLVARLDPRPDYDPFRSLLAAAAVCTRRSDLLHKARGVDDRARWLLGDRLNGMANRAADGPPGPPARRAFPQGGYWVLGCDWETEREVRLVIDAGPLGYLAIAAHGHADALAFTLSIGGREFLVDPGTYAYHTQRRWRDHFRGSAAHNTVVVDGADQSQGGGNFLWLRHARATCERFASDAALDHFSGHHDGYRRLADPVTHHRTVRLFKASRRIAVEDRIVCAGRHAVERWWHFAEACEVALEGTTVVARQAGIVLRLRPLQPVQAALYRGDAERPAGWVSRGYDRKGPAPAAVWSGHVEGDTTLGAELTIELPGGGPSAADGLRRDGLPD